MRLSDVPPEAITHVKRPLTVALPNGHVIRSIAQTTLPVPSSAVAIDAHIFSDVDLHESLTALGPLCNQGCTAILTQTDVTILDPTGTRILHGTKAPHETLWPLPLPTFGTSPPRAHNVIRHELDAEFVAFVHASFGFPAVSTFLAAAKRNYLDSFPRITAAMISANRPNAVATARGHLDQTRHSMRSTSPVLPSSATPALPFAVSDTSPIDEFTIADSLADDQSQYHHVFTLLVPTADMCSADLTGRVPVSSRRGYLYWLVSISNGYIHFELLVSRSSTHLVKAYKATLAFFAQRRRSVSIVRLDNETST